MDASPDSTLKPANVQATYSSLELCDKAADVLKAAGFVLMDSSMKSEACYYGLPGHTGSIRIAAHRFGRTEARSLSMPVLACVTIPANMRSEFNDGFMASIALAVGRFMLANMTHDGRDAMKRWNVLRDLPKN